jgi:hypothetical protein
MEIQIIKDIFRRKRKVGEFLIYLLMGVTYTIVIKEFSINITSVALSTLLTVLWGFLIISEYKISKDRVLEASE